MNVKPQSITRKKDTKRAVALDSENNNVCVKDIVKVIDGPHSVGIFTIFEPRYEKTNNVVSERV